MTFKYRAGNHALINTSHVSCRAPPGTRLWNGTLQARELDSCPCFKWVHCTRNMCSFSSTHTISSKNGKENYCNSHCEHSLPLSPHLLTQCNWGSSISVSGLISLGAPDKHFNARSCLHVQDIQCISPSCTYCQLFPRILMVWIFPLTQTWSPASLTQYPDANKVFIITICKVCPFSLIQTHPLSLESWFEPRQPGPL